MKRVIKTNGSSPKQVSKYLEGKELVSYLENVLLQNLRNGQSMFCVLSGNYCQVADLKTHIRGKILESKAVVLRHLIAIR